MCFSFLLDNQVFWNAAGAAVGGFLGVVILFLVKWGIEVARSKPKVVKIYQCASSINRGQKTEVEGELKHHHGKRVEIKEELEKIDAKNPVWQWTRDRTGDNSFAKGGSIFYGPYATDLTDQGLYSIIFRIRGVGFTKPKEITNDVNLLKLDVNCILPQIVGVQQGVAGVQKHEDAGRRFVRVSELAQGGWQDFELRVWSNGRGIWEYRAWAFDGSGLDPDSFADLDKNVKIFFETVTIKKIQKVNLPQV
jgi:hypothetical protein